MYHYTKLTIVGARLVALLLLLLGVAGLLSAAIQSLAFQAIYPIREAVMSWASYLLCGAALYALSKPVGRWLSRGVE